MRIVAISDQHGRLPDIPPCDLLLVAGDNCPDKVGGIFAGRNPLPQRQWFLEDWMRWRAKQPAAFCVATFGNHDFCGEGLHAVAPTRCHNMGTLTAVDDVVQLGRLRIWLTPWSNRFRDWAFMGSEDQLAEKYARIPEGIDILVSHQPPSLFGGTFLDLATGTEEQLGSRALTDAILRVRPKVVVCGHVHSGYGRLDYDGTTIYNVSVVNERYELANAPTQFDFEGTLP